jgi:hypothetical protein
MIAFHALDCLHMLYTLCHVATAARKMACRCCQIPPTLMLALSKAQLPCIACDCLCICLLTRSYCLQIYFANEIERRYGSQGLHANSVHPGGIMTDLARHLNADTVKSMASLPGMGLKIKSPEQGAATTVWAAIGKQWEGHGGKYLEDCMMSEPYQHVDATPLASGFAPHAYDEQAAKQLWDVSVKLVGSESD